jgi:hypothetical protein
VKRTDLEKLAKRREEWCVSIYTLTHRKGRETQQDPIRFKNLLSGAQERLSENGVDPTEADSLLKPGRELLQDTPFWQHQSDGLAMFLAPGAFHYYCLPIAFEELLVVSDRFHIKPLLPLFFGDGRFFILALSQNEVRLFQGSHYSVTDIHPRGLPQGLADALRYDDPEKQLQFHTGTPDSGQKRPAIYHGQGAGADDDKDTILRYFRKIDSALHPLFREEDAPLVLAGVEYLCPIYKEANTYPHLMDGGIQGNPETLPPEELHHQAWDMVRPLFLKAQKDAANQYRQLAQSERASNEPREVIPAAHGGRVEFLFVALGTQIWGTFDPKANRAHLHKKHRPGDEDLLDFAAVRTLFQGGTVYAVDPQKLPDDGALAAVFRY